MDKFFNFKRESIILALLAIPFIYMGLIWSQIPNQIPIHFNFMGEPDSWTDKINNLYFSLAINLGMYIILLFLPKIDPKKANFKLFSNEFYIIRLALQVFFSAIIILSLYKSLNADFAIGRYIINLILGLFIVLGNLFGKLRFNYTVGIRVPWTLNSEEVWTKTHRLAGKYWVIGSLSTIIIGLFLDQIKLGILFVANMIIISIVPIVYSFIISRKIKANEE